MNCCFVNLILLLQNSHWQIVRKYKHNNRRGDCIKKNSFMCQEKQTNSQALTSYVLIWKGIGGCRSSVNLWGKWHLRCAVGGDGGGWEAVVGALRLFAPSSHDTVRAKHSTNYEKMLDLFHWSHFELLLEFVHTSTRTGIALWTTTQFF